MNQLSKIFLIVVSVTGIMHGAGCAPEVGSEKWCQQLSEKPKGEWTANEAADYAKHCLFK